MQQIPLNPITLNFDATHLETKYWEAYLPGIQNRTTLAVSMVLFLYAIFGLLDPWIVPEAVRWVWPIRALIVVQCLVILLLVRRPVFRRWHQVIIASLPVIGGLGLLAMIGLAEENGRQLYYVGLILAMIWLFMFADLAYLYSILISLGLIGGYELIVILLKPIPLPALLNNTFFLLGTLLMAASAGYMIKRYERLHFFQSLLIDQERERSDDLLLQILPKEITEVLKRRSGTIADRFNDVSVMFADIVGFTSLSSQMPPDALVELLSEAFSYFDSLVERYELEKIRTIGDNYMVASGVPRPRPDHAHALAYMALDIQDYATSSIEDGRPRFQFRIGINSGPVVAGIIGKAKFQYDLWGETVNTASRMESQGLPGKIQIAEKTRQNLADAFILTRRGIIDVKGIGPMETWFLECPRLVNGVRTITHL